MATLQKENFSRWTINNSGGSTNNCFPSIIATFLRMDTKTAESKCIGFPARTGRKYGGTHIRWSNPAQQVSDSFGIAATDAVKVSGNTGYTLKKHGTTSQVAKSLKKGVYVIIHKGHAYGLIVTNGKAYTVDYGKGNAARRIVWTCTRLDGVDADSLLAEFRGQWNTKESSMDSNIDQPLQKRAERIAQQLEKKSTPPTPRAVRVYTKDGALHVIITAQESREFVRAHGMDRGILAGQWDKIHALQF